VRLRTRLASAVIVLALVSGCGNDGRAPNPVVSALGQMAKSSLAKTRGAEAATPAAAPVSRDELEAFGKPILRIKAERLGQDAFLTIADVKGNVVTWTAQGAATFSLRDGVLIQTRGLGPDLMSADAPALTQLTGGGNYPRVYFFLGEDDRGTRRSYDCKATTIGRETIEILGKSYATTHVTELCSRPNSTVTNEFWIDGEAIRKSRQWASSRVGHIEFERVID
jgi:hypothetical protein